MRLLIPALLGSVAIGGYASSPGSSALSIVGVVPTLELTEGYIRAQTDGGVGAAASDEGTSLCSSLKPCVDGSCCNSDGMSLTFLSSVPC
jgi:hypothetical protein